MLSSSSAKLVSTTAGSTKDTSTKTDLEGKNNKEPTVKLSYSNFKKVSELKFCMSSSKSDS